MAYPFLAKANTNAFPNRRAAPVTNAKGCADIPCFYHKNKAASLLRKGCRLSEIFLFSKEI
jgi:hypothetical protein